MSDLPKIDLTALDGTVRADALNPKAKPEHAKVPGEADWTKLRKAAPLNRLLEPTVRWAGGLPADVQPHTLMAKHPRLANMAAASWGDPAAFQEFLDVLLIDNRGGRQGFPPEIRAELEQLRTYRLFGWFKPRSDISIYREGRPDEKTPR